MCMTGSSVLFSPFFSGLPPKLLERQLSLKGPRKEPAALCVCQGVKVRLREKTDKSAEKVCLIDVVLQRL